MIRVSLFGAPALERDGTLLSGRATQRHRLALVALLSLTPGCRLSRDKLIAWLWPESDTERGRNLLKVATYVLRSALDDDVLISAGDELRLNTDLVEVDVAEFDAALQRLDFARAIALYRGPFLDGFFLPDAPEFAHWADGERMRLAGGYCRALEAVAEQASAAGDSDVALQWWKLRAAQDPFDSRVALRLMHAFEATGNRAGALQHGAIHTRLLENEFGMGSPEVATLTERLRQEPAREIDVSIDTVAVAHAPARVVLPPQTARKRSARRAVSVVTLAMLAFVSAVSVWPRNDPQPRSIVVLPFVNMTVEGENEYFSDGLTEEIITRLAAVPGLKVISRTSAMHYKGTKKALPQIARELGVDHILEGSVRQDSGRVRISAQLIDARVDGHIWADNYDDDRPNDLSAQEKIAQEVVRALELKLTARTRRLLVRPGTRDAAAKDLYQRGRYAWNTRTRVGHLRAIDYFQRAIARDPQYADAYAGLAHAYGTGFMLNLSPTPEAEVYRQLKRAADRALALDDESAEAHVARAVALQWQRDWQGADQEFRRALELNPGNAVAHTWYSLLLRGMGRSQEALHESQLAAQLDPFGIISLHNYALQCYIVRDYDCASEQFGRTLEVGPYPGAFRGQALVYVQQGRWHEAVATARQAVTLAPERPDFLADLAYVLARAGRGEEARATLQRAAALPFEPYNVGRAWVALGEVDSAFVWLERSNWRWPHRAYRTDPALDPLRASVRFEELVRRVDVDMGMQ
jgi:TolB-like protein/DNA-binding SARP family transcriptional activator/Tfp pilus assembly protein PilF